MKAWPIPPGPLAVNRSSGTTPTERYLAELAEYTFLSMWSYPNLWRDQRPNGVIHGDGRELCDLLVLFDEHIIIFSDKHVEYKPHDDPAVSWNRWYKQAIKESADQIFGAEGWIRQFPERVFLDSSCTKRLPITLPPKDKLVIHRVVVARGAGDACRAYFRGGSGSLMIVPDIIAEAHLAALNKGLSMSNSEIKVNSDGLFRVGQIDPARGYVHVLDDVSLDILMSTLDTVQDFVDYLVSKERFILSGRLIGASGEEDLLAYYLEHTGPDRKHAFKLPNRNARILIDEGYWKSFHKNPQRLAQIDADRISYIWDDLIERFAFHALNDSQYYTTGRGATATEPIVRFLAREPRLRRRMLADAILGLADRAQRLEGVLQVRVIESTSPNTPYYVFLTLKSSSKVCYADYREARRDALAAYIEIVKAMRPVAQDIVGVAFGVEDNSEDLLYFDARNWSKEDQRTAENLQRDTGFLKTTKIIKGTHKEYPIIDQYATKKEYAKGNQRNQHCHCNSGLKYKRCHGR